MHNKEILHFAILKCIKLIWILFRYNVANIIHISSIISTTAIGIAEKYIATYRHIELE